MIHLTPADWRWQPWANGRGRTAELWRLDRGGNLVARLSLARVDQDGPFSVLPGLARNLTVLTGPGFRLTGPGGALDCRPLTPVAFDGALEWTASDTAAGASEDFNVMTAASLPRPQVEVAQDADLPGGGTLALLALGAAAVNGTDLSNRDLILTEGPARLRGRALVMRLWLDG